MRLYWHDWVRVGAVLLAMGMCSALGGCPPPPTVEPETTSCGDVCTHWEGLGCDEAKPTPAGEPCVSVCESMVETGIFEWDLDCMAQVKGCADIEGCAE